MGKTKIEYVDYTWNPIVGCKNGCFYCYAKRINDRFKIIPKWEMPEFTTEENYYWPLMRKKPARILVCSMADMFGDWIIKEWIDAVLNIVKDCPQHTFLFLTKNPVRYSVFEFPGNCWLGTTITWGERRDIVLNRNKSANLKFISIEPLLAEIPKLILEKISWLIIGAMTGTGSQHYKPKINWIENILTQADDWHIPVFMKDNLKKLWKGEMRQEFPR